MKKINLLILIFLLNSCANLSKKFIPSNDTKKINSVSNPCLKQPVQFLHENNFASKLSEEFTKSSYFKNLNFVEKGLSLFLLELERRPDKYSPNSKTQIIIFSKNKHEYFEFSKEEKMPFPYFQSIDYLLNKFSNKNLLTFTKELDQHFPDKLNVDEELENFIYTNKQQIEKIEKLKTLWMRGDDSITHFETYKRPLLENIVNLYVKLKNNNSNIITPKTFPFKFSTEKNNSNISCNFDFKAEIDQIDINSKASKEKQSYFAYKEQDNFILFLTSNIIDQKLIPIEQTTFLKLNENKESIPVCYLENSKHNMALISLDGRAKSQHLKHVIDYEIEKANNLENVNEILKFSRHLFLTGPDRILYESKKGRKEQLDFFLTMNFPIYHIENMGNIIGIYQNNLTSTKSSLINDIRSNSSLTCPN